MHLGALGDFVLSWPALGLLAGAGQLHLWGRAEWGRLILPPDRVHERESARFASLFSGQPNAGLQDWLGGFERAAVFAQKPPAGLLAGLETVLPGKVWQVPTRPSDSGPRHAAEVQVSALRSFGLTRKAPPLSPRLSGLPETRPVLAPGSGGKNKRLPASIIKRALAAWQGEDRPPLPPLVVLGPAEDEGYRNEVRGLLRPCQAELLCDPTIAELAAVLAAAPVYLGADSGVSHLAAALGAPCLVGFGPTNPEVWAPLGKRVYIKSFEELNRLNFAAMKWK